MAGCWPGRCRPSLPSLTKKRGVCLGRYLDAGELGFLQHFPEVAVGRAVVQFAVVLYGSPSGCLGGKQDVARVRHLAVIRLDSHPVVDFSQGIDGICYEKLLTTCAQILECPITKLICINY